jgi:hypothetical protein
VDLRCDRRRHLATQSSQRSRDLSAEHERE